MGEGWSDFYALSLLNNTNADDPNGQYASAPTRPTSSADFSTTTSTASAVSPTRPTTRSTRLTWADVDDVTNNLSGGIAPDPLGFNVNGGLEVHNVGEVWALTLWEVRSRVIADPAGANGDVPTGNNTMLQLVTDGLKMTPDRPELHRRARRHLRRRLRHQRLRQRGLDLGRLRGPRPGLRREDARTTSRSASPRRTWASTSRSVSPFLDVDNPATDVAIDDSASNNNGAIDPGEAISAHGQS